MSAPAGSALSTADVSAYALRLGDDALVYAQRLAEWLTRAPELEEDVALANLALDLLGQARTLLTYAGELEGAGRDEDALAYLRDADAFTSCLLVELPRGDFAAEMARLLLFSAYQCELYAALTRSADPTLAAIAAKAVKEVSYHRDHAAQWVLRLGDGTEQSHRRMQAALDDLERYAWELFEADEVTARLVATGVAPDPQSLRDRWEPSVRAVVAEATLAWPQSTERPTGGRSGRHTEHLAPLLAELQELHRAHPGARW